MDELTIGDKIFISSKRAAAITGYAKDYVGQLCREGHVEAKMVGRSWYVLESSIRAHRFGQPEPVSNTGGVDQKEDAVGSMNGREGADVPAGGEVQSESLTHTWEAPKYVAEEVPTMPELTLPPVISETRETPQSLDMSEDRESLTEMQTAWKEWFENKQEPVTESSEVVKNAPENVPEKGFNEVVDRPYEDVVEEVVEEAVPVPVHRIPEARPARVETRPVVPAYDRAQLVEVGQRVDTVHIREKRVRRRSHGPTNLVYGALMVAIAGVVIAVGFIGSGFADTYLGYNPIIEYLGGASSISK